jgi:hypothetical protein
MALVAGFLLNRLVDIRFLSILLNLLGMTFDAAAAGKPGFFALGEHAGWKSKRKEKAESGSHTGSCLVSDTLITFRIRIQGHTYSMVQLIMSEQFL